MLSVITREFRSTGKRTQALTKKNEATLAGRLETTERLDESGLLPSPWKRVNSSNLAAGVINACDR